MPSQCQAAGGKSAFSVAAKGSSVSPNPNPNPNSPCLRWNDRIYTYIRVRAVCVCVSQCQFVLFFLFASPSHVFQQGLVATSLSL